MPNFESRRAAFRELHAGGCFVIPNPWDIGSARYLQHLGFKALATTSAGDSDLDAQRPIDMHDSLLTSANPVAHRR